MTESWGENGVPEWADDAVDGPAYPAGAAHYTPSGRLKKRYYEAELARLQEELVALQYWVHDQGLRVLIIFEGRGAAGKGGVIKRITERTSPRIVRVVALPRPTERETTQWYFQRYIEHLPSAGEIVLFDRSWYSRSNVERVMGFCTEEQHQEFLRSCPEFERMLVRSGMKVLKYWFSVSWQEQRRRFEPRNEEPLKRWKLSDIDLEHRVADIDQLHRDWSSRGATFLTTPDRPGAETRCSMRDPDRHLLEVARRRGCSGRIDSQRWWVSHQPGRSALRPAEGSWR